MLPHSHYVGRIGRVDDAQCVLNGEYVTVEGCDDSTSSYRVHPVNQPPDKDSDLVRVSADQLHFTTSDEFSFRHPNPFLLKGSANTKEIDDGSIVDFSDFEQTPLDGECDPMVIQGSCRLTGNYRKGVEGSFISREFIIDTTHGDDIVEFENLFFQCNYMGENDYLIVCLQGIIQFRNCLFVSNTHIISVGGTAKVTMESCTVRNEADVAVFIRMGELVMVNCTISAKNIGLLAFGQCTLVHCVFRDCVGGIVCPTSAEICVLSSSFFGCSDFSVAVRNGAKLSMTSCTVRGSGGVGIVIEGGDRTSALINKCTFRKCAVAVRIGNGLVDVQLLDSAVYKCSVGMYTMIDTIGSIVMSSNVIGGNAVDLLDVSGTKCYTNIDGELQSHGAQHANLVSLQDTISAATGSILAYGYPVSKFGRRQLKIAGVKEIVCGKCGILEPAHTKFNICGKCNCVSYCSKDCQVKHWYASHREECKLMVYRAECMRSKGFVGCENCHLAEHVHRAGKKLFPACGRCWRAVYCSKECQRAHWVEHQYTCTRSISKDSREESDAVMEPDATDEHTDGSGVPHSSAHVTELDLADAVQARTAELLLRRRAIEFDHVNDLTVENFMDCVLYLQMEGPKTSVVAWIGKLHRCVADIVETEEIQERLTQETVQAMKEFIHHHPQYPDVVEQADGTGLCLYAPGTPVPDVDEVMAFVDMFNIDI